MKVVFMPAGKSVEAEYGKSLLQAAMEHGIFVDSPCGGHHTCGKCKVFVTKGNDHDYQEEEKEVFTKEELARGMRLACCCLVVQNMAVIIPPVSRGTGMKERQEVPFMCNNGAALGVAIDVGTTTVEVHLVDLSTSVVLRKCKVYNPQIAFGADVVARISYAAGNAAHEQQLRDCLREEISMAIRREVAVINQSVSQIEKIVLVGNTTMSYILTNTPLSYLAKAPFSLVYQGNTTFSTKQLGILPECNAKVYVGPNIGGHVGSDAFACLLAVGQREQDMPYLIVDVGTNGEILLVTKERTYACSTAAGPAFEGAGLSCGMRAEPGAITRAELKEGVLTFLVEGNTPPVGISGSGIIDVLAGMLRLHLMDDSGYLDPQYCTEKGFEVAKGVFLRREDVRQIQLAKGAIHAGIITLLEKAGVKLEELRRVYLAGAFGTNINSNNAMMIGLLPKVEPAYVCSIGNAAVQGAKQLLTQGMESEEYDAIRHKITHIELANLDSFHKHFIDSINFRSDLC